MTFGLRKEKDHEEWLKPFTAPVRLRASQRTLHSNSRLFFELYWQLLAIGYTEEQIADYAALCYQDAGLPDEIDLAQGVFRLANHWGIEVKGPFLPQVTVT